MVGFTDYADPDHDYDDHDHGDEDEDFGIIVAKIGTLVGSMYAMWLVGSLMRLSGNGHGHSHGGFETPTQSNTEMVKQENPDEQKLEEVDMGSKSSLPSEVKWSTIWGIMIGDCFHNFVGMCSIKNLRAWFFCYRAMQYLPRCCANHCICEYVRHLARSV